MSVDKLVKPIIDFDTYITLADEIASEVLELFFPELLPADDEEFDPEFDHRKCAETEDAIRMCVRERIEWCCDVPNNPFANCMYTIDLKGDAEHE
ncbi:MAG: hypothetical protein ACPHQD_04760 [Vibrio toranzoniae]|uniref:hypothetical protein n=1 Tax=Vibrio toranzoniae TaxID=1194427 RepID=UPI003C37098B